MHPRTTVTSMKHGLRRSRPGTRRGVTALGSAALMLSMAVVVASVLVASPTAQAAKLGRAKVSRPGVLTSCTATLGVDGCTIATGTNSATINYTLTLLHPSCNGIDTSGCVGSVFTQSFLGGLLSGTSTVAGSCHGSPPWTFATASNFSPLLGLETTVSCSTTFSWSGEYPTSVGINVIELNGQAITIANSDHQFGGPIPPPPPVASFTYAAVPGQPGAYVFTSTSASPTNLALSEAWTSSDGGTGTGVTWSHTFESSTTYTVTLEVTDSASNSDSASQNVTVTLPTTPPGNSGYLITGSDGSVYTFGSATPRGDLPASGVRVNNIKGLAVTADQAGYWMVGADGGVFAFGDAGFVGSLPSAGIRVSNVVGIAATADHGGYWMVGADGGVFAFGDAALLGSLPGNRIHVSNIVAITST